MKPVAEALGVSRSHLSTTARNPSKKRGGYDCCGDAVLTARIVAIVQVRSTYGYRRVTALLSRQKPAQPVNHKRVYRLMKRAQLLSLKYGSKPERPHNGKVITLASDLRWCSDAGELRRWSREKVRLAFALDCCDREIIGWVATDGHLDGEDIRDLTAQSVEARFDAMHTPHPIEWLSDNGPQYVARETRSFGAASGLLVSNTPAVFSSLLGAAVAQQQLEPIAGHQCSPLHGNQTGVLQRPRRK